MNRSLPFVSALFALFAAPTVAGQDLRKGLASADLVVVGRQVGKQAANAQLTLHRLQIVDVVRGGTQGLEAVVVLDWPTLALHQRPSPRQQKLYCLRDATGTAAKAGLPADQGPYYMMVGYSGSNPLIGADLEHDPVLGFARILAAAEAGANPADTAGAICNLALRGDAAVRTEAVMLLSERSTLRSRLTPVQWSELVARATGETEAVPYKIALCELCAEQHIDGLLEALVVSLGAVDDPEFARCVGRIAHLRGEDGARPLQTRLQTARDDTTRKQVLLALGASNTRAGLQTLLQLRGNIGADAAVDAALREHRSPQAREAVLRDQAGKK